MTESEFEAEALRRGGTVRYANMPAVVTTPQIELVKCQTRAYTLPYPHTVNHYWRFCIIDRKPRIVLSAKGKAYRAQVARVVNKQGLPPLKGRLAVGVLVYPPDRRKRDLGNLDKGLMDALVKAGAIEDDSQIDDLRYCRMKPVKGGKVSVDIEVIGGEQ